jgi:hypothetical protein
MNEFYVYLYLREDGTPYYVGKGKGNRAFKNRGRRMKPPINKTRIIFHAENLTEEEAFALEKELIAKYGRKDNDTGILRNLTDGGEGTSGIIFSDERKAKLSEIAKENLNRPEVKARIMNAINTPEAKAKMSASAKERMSKPEVKSKALAALNTPEVNAKRKASLNKPEVKNKTLERLNTPEVKAKRKASLNKPEVKNKTRAGLQMPEAKAKRRESLKKTCATPEKRAEMSLIAKEAMNRPEVKAKHLAAVKEYWRKKREAKQASANTLTKFFS